jgi:hypothetical protein
MNPVQIGSFIRMKRCSTNIFRRGTPYYNQYSEVISVTSHGSVYAFPHANAVHGVTLNTVEYPGTQPPSPVSGWHIVISPPASL